MRIRKNLNGDQENILRFLDVLGNGLVALSGKKRVRPEFFLLAHEFIEKNVFAVFFKKEEVLIKTLQDHGFPADEGPVGVLRTDHQKSREAADALEKAAKLWHVGDDLSRADVIWACSEFGSTMRGHTDKLRNLVFPLLEQTIPVDDEHKISEEMNKAIAGAAPDYAQWGKQVKDLEEELSDWL